MLTQGAQFAECILLCAPCKCTMSCIYTCVYYYTYAGRSLHFAPSVPEIRVDSGNDALLQCVLEGDSTQLGSFLWTGPAVASGRAAIILDSSGTVSTLTIAGVGRSDEGSYTCSFTGVDTISITLDVVCKLRRAKKCTCCMATSYIRIFVFILYS